MAYETITVRMNRSNSSIPWGFHVYGGNNHLPIRIATVENGSLADKAGLQVGDVVIEFSNHSTKGMSLQEARNIVERASLEIYILLQRQITEHSCIPWELTEKNNKITIDHITPQTVNYHYQKNEQRNSARSTSTSTYEVPITNESSNYRESSKSYHQESSLNHRPPFTANYQSAAPFTNATNTQSPYARSTHFQDIRNSDSYRIESRNGNEHNSYRKPMPDISRNVPIAALHTSPISPAALVTPNSYRIDSNSRMSVPIHVDTSNANSNVGYPSSRSASGYDPVKSTPVKPTWQNNESHVPFRHSPRNERQLSPHASISHLQYNSPINLYSPHTANEQYMQQTGGHFGNDSSLQQPKGDEVYLKSETRHLIAEEEGKRIREKSPSAQSASFKRISRACGALDD